MADHQETEDRRPQPCDRAWHDDLSRACPGRTSATSGRARARPPTMTTARASRSAGSTWSPTPAPISTRRSTASPTARTWPTCRWPRSPTCPAIVVRRPWENDIAVDAAAFEGLDVRGKAVLVHTGWDRHWRTERYGDDHPFLTATRPTGWSSMARRWSGSTATISTTRGCGRGRCTRAARRRHPDLRAYDRPRRSCRTRASASPRCRRRCAGWGPSRCAPTPCSTERARLPASRE